MCALDLSAHVVFICAHDIQSTISAGGNINEIHPMRITPQFKQGGETMDFSNYITPELLIIVPVLNFIGYVLKRSSAPDNQIPLILAATGVFLALIWVLSQQTVNLFAAAFTAIVQGILCAAGAVFTNQIVKQKGKNRDE